jgi:hypothetical protein
MGIDEKLDIAASLGYDETIYFIMPSGGLLCIPFRF